MRKWLQRIILKFVYNKLNVNGDIYTFEQLEEKLEEEEENPRKGTAMRYKRTISERSLKEQEFGKEDRINKMIKQYLDDYKGNGKVNENGKDRKTK